MWNRKKDDEPVPRINSAPPTPSDLAREGIPMSTLPSRTEHHSPGESMRGPATAVIGKSVVVKGQIYAREDLMIDGEVEGSVEATDNRIVVGPNGKVTAGMKGREVIIQGTVKGNVDAAEKADIRKDAKLVGDIRTARIVIEDGAFFKGSVDIVRPEAKQQTLAAAAPKPAPAPAPSAVPEVKR
jgi:cytoskeletal protein CcmA (bactofilin family)